MNLAQTKALMAQFDIRPTRSLGQNFLIDEKVVSSIADLAEIEADDRILEIGPGLGHLTVELARRAGHVIAVEIDRHIMPALKANLADFPNVELIHGDALQINLHQALSESTRGGVSVKVVANLPYYVTTELLLKIMLEIPEFKGLYLMMQKEAAERIMSDIGTRDYSPVGVVARSLGMMKRSIAVGRGSFYPQPHVDSVVLELIPAKNPLVQPSDMPGFAAFLQRCFRQRRKTLLNSFGTLQLSGKSEEQGNNFEVLLDRQGLNRMTRAETMSPAQFADLYHSILELSRTV